LKQYVQNVMRICKLCDSVEYVYSKVLYADNAGLLMHLLEYLP